MLALVGQAPTALDGRGSFQDTSGRNGSLSAEALFSEISVYCRRVLTPADILTALPEAVAAARAGGPAGAAAAQERPAGPWKPRCRHQRRRRRYTHMRPGDPHPIARALQRARGPVTIIAGEQVARDDARAELEELRTGAARLGRDRARREGCQRVARLGASSSLGVTGVMGHPGVADAVRKSAVCLLVGTRMSVTARAGLDDALARCGRCRSGRRRPTCPAPTCTPMTCARRCLSSPCADWPGRPPGLRVLDPMPRTELQPPPTTARASGTATR